MSVRAARPRENVLVRVPDGRSFEGPLGTPLSEAIEAAFPDPPAPIMAAVVNRELRRLDYTLQGDAEIVPIDTTSNIGMRIYNRAVSFLLVVAANDMYPDHAVIIDHSVTLGGFYCQIEGMDSLSEQAVCALEARMHELVAADEPIGSETLELEEARTFFASQGYDDKVRLLDGLEEKAIVVNTLRGVRDYFYGINASRTGSLRWFGLEPYASGLILRLPSRQHPTTLYRRTNYPKMMGVLRDYGRWLGILGVEDMGSLNRVVQSDAMREIVLVSEALHEKLISDIADQIVRHDPPAKLVLIAGPSSSGKTTFSRRLAIQLRVNGLRPFALGLDDYFVDRDKTPRDAHGEYDFEALEAINLALFGEQLLALMNGEAVPLAHYNFKTGKSERREPVALAKDTVIIVEGIHGLNPRLIASLPAERIYRIYVSALTQLNIDHHNRVPTTDTRLLRRIVRDARHRGYSARDTIGRWESVRRGEERYIFPYQENADSMFNSALVYEMAVIKPLVEPLLLRVPHGTREGLEAQRLLSFLKWVRPCSAEWVPDNSLLREFVGGSILRNFVF